VEQAFIVTGSLTDAQTLKLDEPFPLTLGKVRVIVELLPHSPGDYEKFMAELRERQRRRGHVPRTREEIDASLKAERDSWDD
jgi:hypothetical protein